jgi:hypothetical protein
MTVYRRNPLLMTVMGANPGPRTRKTAEKALDAAISGAWHRLMSGVQVPIMDIPRIFRDIKLEMAAGVPLEQAVSSVGTRYRVNRNPFGEAILGGVAGALVNRAFQSNPHLEGHPCSMCSGELTYLGTLGGREHYRCRACGWESSFEIPTMRKARHARYRKLCGHGKLTNQCPRCRGRKMPSSVRPCRHGYSGARACRMCEREQRPGGPVKNNPAIQVAWDKLTGRHRLAVLEFAGIPYDDAKYLARRSWGALPSYAKVEVSKGWRDTTMRKRETVQANPGPRGKKRRMTMTVERFANWVKSKRDPAMWKAFLAKFKGYESWTHGSRARKVTVEWVDTPGVDGLWITYDGGKQPESTYIMPKGSKRKGAWKHPWDTMPDIKHDPQAGIVLTKLRGKSAITDFYHR